MRGQRSNVNGGLEVLTKTAGSAVDPDGHTVVLDGAAGSAIGVNDLVTLYIAAGEHEVLLSNVANNCRVTGTNPAVVTVTVGQVTRSTFGVACPPFFDPIAFNTDRDGNDEVYVMGGDGSNPLNLQPRWSAR